ncbi:MAG: SCO family protein [Bradyrhizobium sp.]|nr:SCO family protein [Bradyrhizobium sp.]MDU6138020.1 SCO family protein [Bradyrhizobium sp.]
MFGGSLLVGLWLMLGALGSMRAAAAIGGPFHLEDQQGISVTEAALKGRPTILFFGFTHCPDICPTTLFEISEMLRALGPDADRLNTWFVSVDPERDTRAVMAEYLTGFDPHIRGLTGTPDELKSLLQGYKVYARKVPLAAGDYTVDHTASVYLMNRESTFVSSFNLKRPLQAAVADLRRFF